MTALAMEQKGLSPATKIVLYWLADHHNASTGLCCPSQKTLAAECEMSDRSIRTHLNLLVKWKLIEVVEHHRDNGSQTSNRYRLLFGEKKFPPPAENISTPPRKKFPTHNLGNNNLGKDNTHSYEVLCASFNSIWNIWPRKHKKVSAFKAYTNAMNKVDAKYLAEIIELQCLQYSKTEIRYVAYLENWLNDERWNDDHLVKAHERKKNNKNDR